MRLGYLDEKGSVHLRVLSFPPACWASPHLQSLAVPVPSLESRSWSQFLRTGTAPGSGELWEPATIGFAAP